MRAGQQGGVEGVASCTSSSSGSGLADVWGCSLGRVMGGRDEEEEEEEVVRHRVLL